MNSIQILMASTATLCIIFAGRVQSQVFMHNGKIYDDKFHELFIKKAPVKEIIKLAVDWDAQKQLDHFSQLLHHINNKDESAKYAESVVNGTQAVLQKSLEQVGYKKEMTLEQYLLARYQIQNKLRSEVNPDVLEGIELLDKIPGDEFEKLLDEGQREEINWELDNLHPYTIVLNPPETTESVSESQNNEKVPAPESQGSEDIVPQSQETTEKPVEDLQEPEQQIPTPEESGEQIPTLQESAEQIPTDQESVQSLPEEIKESAEQIPTAQESAESLPEEIKESAEQIPTEQESVESSPEEIKESVENLPEERKEPEEQITQTQESTTKPVDGSEENLQESVQEDEAEPLKSEEITSQQQNSEETQVDSQESQES